MARIKKLGTDAYLSVQEILPAVLLVLCSFFKTFAVVSLDAGSSVLFLNAYSGHNIAQIFIATAVLFFLIWPGLATLRGKKAGRLAVILFIAGVISLIFYALSFLTAEPLIYAGAMVWKEGFKIIAETVFWVAAFRFGVFNGRSKKLLFILTAQAFAVLCAAGLIRLTPNALLDSLMLWSAVFTFAAAFTLNTLIADTAMPIVEKPAFRKQKIKRSGSDSVQREIYLCFYVLSGLLFFAAGLFNYYFLSLTALTYENRPAEMANVYSVVFALTAVLSFALLQLSAKGKLSPFFLLYVIPVALLAAAGGGWFSIFGLIAAGKAVLDLAAPEARESTLLTIPLAVSLRTGFRANMLRKSVVEPFAMALCGVFVWYAENKMAEQVLIYVMTMLAVIVFVAVLIMRRVYLRLILNMLKSYLWRGGRLLLTGKRVSKYLTSCLADSDTQKVLYALRALEEAQSPIFFDCLERALHHKNEDVRLYALAKIESLKFYEAIGFVELMVQNDESLNVRRTALRVMCRLGGEEARDKAVDLINDRDVCAGALAGLLAVGREGVFVAIERTASLAVSEDPADRLLAAVVLGNAGNPAFYHPLIHLLNDEDISVCKAALDAAGKLQNPRLLPAVMETFRFPELRESGVDVLLQFGEKAFQQIETVLLSKDYPVQFRILLTRVVSRISSPESEKFLFKHIRIEDREIRFNIAKSLVLSGSKAVGKNVNAVRLCLYDEIETATGLLAAVSVFDKDDNPNHAESLKILKSALTGEIEYIKERILLLLALLQPSAAIREFLDRRYAAGADETSNETIKIVDKILSGELRTLCLPLFEKKTVRQQLALLRPHFFPPVLSVDGHIRDLLDTPKGELTDWTRACAAYSAGNIKEISFVNSLTALLDDPDPIVRETAVWAIGQILPREESSRLLAGCLTDPASGVARTARFIIDGTGQTVF